MTVHLERQTEELEQEGKVETELVAVRYTGLKSSVPPDNLRDQGGWNGTSAFQGGSVKERDEDGRVVEREPGPWQLGVVPDILGEDVEGGALHGIENNPDFEVAYSAEKIARALLEMNYLPPTVFGGEGKSYKPELREKLFEKLDAQDDVEWTDEGVAPDATGAYREQLAEIAGIEPEDDSEIVDKSRVQEYLDNYTRGALMSAASTLEKSGDINTGKRELAEWLAERDARAVEYALNGEDDEARRVAGLKEDKSQEDTEETGEET